MTVCSELRVLGDLALCSDGDERPIGGPKAQQLLSVLIAHHQDPVSSDRLIDSLWGGRPPRTAAATVQTQISRLRTALPEGFSISLGPTGYRLDTPPDGLDASRFEVLMSRRASLGREESVPVLEAALALWHGPAFGQCAELAEVRSEAVRLDELRLVATDEWAEARVATGDPASMVAELEALVRLHPLRECYWRLLMEALYRCGRQGEALRRAEELRELLGAELGLDLSPTVRELQSRILADDPTLRAPRGSSTLRRSRSGVVPRLLGVTSFIGRDPDVFSLSESLRDQPLVTLTGPGGVGKTRLAMRVAGVSADSFPDGVTVVEFAPLRDPTAVAPVIAHALDIQQRQYRTIESTIEEHLAPLNSLVVLDNCEHVADTVAPLVDRLRSSCPDLRILTTSREPLGLAGEYVEILAPLSLPDSDAVTAAEIRNSDAVELFVSRAAAASRTFALTDDNAVVVAEICRRLDGLPLALELAAARLRSMDVDTLAARLHQRSEMLGQTQRGADGRHRTLHHLVEWSHELLEPHEQRVFEQLAVFAGGFDLLAAEAICSTGEAATSTLGTLASLVEKSMVVFVDPGPPRYRLLEPLREFGLDRLCEHQVLEAVEERHLDWFLEVAERGARGLDGPEEPAWSACLDRDFGNLRAAHLTAVRRDDSDRSMRLVVSLREFAFRRVRYEIESWADASAALPGAVGHPDYPTVLAVSAYGRFVRGDMEAAQDLAHQARLADQDRLADQPQAAPAGSHDPEVSESGLPERVLGNTRFYLEQVEEGLGWMDRMLESARRSGSPARIAHGLYMRSVAQTSVGDGIRGAVLAGEAKAAAEAAGSPTAHAQADYALGLALESTDAAEALSRLERASLIAAEAGNRWIEAFALTEVHWLRARSGDSAAALIGYAQVIDIWYRGGDWANQWLSLRRVLGILVDLGALEAAAVLHGSLAAAGASHALPFEPSDAQRLSDDVEQVRSLLGPAAFADAVRLGASMKDSQIVNYVREQIAQLTGSGQSSAQ